MSQSMRAIQPIFVSGNSQNIEKWVSILSKNLIGLINEIMNYKFA